MKTTKQYLSFLMQNFLVVLLAVIFNATSGYFRSVGAIYLQRITDALEKGILTTLMSLILLGAFFTVFSYVFRWLGAISPRYLGEKFSLVSRLKLVEWLQKIPFSVFENQSIGNLQSIIRNDSVQAGQWIYATISRILGCVFLFIFSVLTMAITNMKATLIIVAIVCFSTWINQIILKKMTPYYAGSRKALGEMTHSLEKSFSSLETVKTYSAKQYISDGFCAKAKEYCRCEQKTVQINTLRVAWFTLISKLCLFAPLIYLGFLGMSGNLTIGEVTMFIYLVREIITPIEVVLRWMASIARYIASLNRIDEVLELPAENRSEVVSLQDIASVETKNLSFSYDQKRQIFHNVNFNVQRGKLTKLSGGSGSGKTTMMKVLLGLYSSETAEFLIDGKPYQNLVGQITYASLDNSIFPLSIFDNMTLGAKEISKQDCMQMLDRLGFSDWVRSLPNEIDTIVYPDSISGGQKQSIVVGRAILSTMPILLLDEPFSALDSAKYELFLAELNKCKENKIILLTSHRQDDDDIYDKIVYLENIS